jgi:hypothetical protein
MQFSIIVIQIFKRAQTDAPCIKIYLIFEFYTQLVPPYLWRWTLFVHVWFSTSLPRLVPYGWADLHETINLWKKVHSGRTMGAMHVMATTKIMRYLKKNIVYVVYTGM